MRFESREKRQYWRNILLSLIPDAVIAFVVSVYSNGGWQAFFLTFLFIWAVSFAFFLRGFIWSWVVYRLWLRDEISEQVFYYLKKNGFPEPLDNERSAVYYLERVLEDESLPTNTRVSAAVEYATLHGYETRGEVMMSIRMDSAYEAGIERYKKTFPIDTNN